MTHNVANLSPICRELLNVRTTSKFDKEVSSTLSNNFVSVQGEQSGVPFQLGENFPTRELSDKSQRMMMMMMISR